MVEDAHNDPRTIGDLAIEAFAAVAWIGYAIEDRDGVVLGTFCLMDSEPREWTSRDVQSVATLAKAASTEIALRMLHEEVGPLRRIVVN
jgi:sigma-B regulation protein RsbU (phosphoserine phosphatase)